MWVIDESKRVESKNPIIVADFMPMLWYDGPVLFKGINHEGAPVVGSLADYPDLPSRAAVSCLHCVPTGADYINYLNRLIDYPTMLANARELYRVDALRTFGGQDRAEEIYRITWDDVPIEYRPHAGALCPPEEDWGSPYDEPDEAQCELIRHES